MQGFGDFVLAADWFERLLISSSIKIIVGKTKSGPFLTVISKHPCTDSNIACLDLYPDTCLTNKLNIYSNRHAVTVHALLKPLMFRFWAHGLTAIHDPNENCESESMHCKTESMVPLVNKHCESESMVPLVYEKSHATIRVDRPCLNKLASLL